MFRRFGFLFIVLGAAVMFRFAASAQDEPNPRATLHAQAHYLSTESAQGSIDIDNTTAREIGYSSLSVTFLIRDAAGHQYERQWITTISHMPTEFWIAPGDHRSFEVTLPKCDVLIDPCTERVAVKLRLSVKNGNGVGAVTNERSYTFDPDPTATFRIDGLRNDRPLFIVQGEAHDTVPQNQGVIEFRFIGDVPNDVQSVVSDILKSHGLNLAGSGSDDTSLQQFDVTAQDRGIEAPTAPELAAAVGDIRRHYGTRAEFVSTYYMPDVSFGFERVTDLARNAASHAAESIAAFVRTTPLSDAYGLSGDSTQIQFGPRADYDNNDAPFVSSQDMPGDTAMRARAQSKVPGLLEVRLRETQGFLGARAISAAAPDSATQEASTEYLADGLTDLAPSPLRTVVAADRPQVFALGFTTIQESARRGAAPDALALTLARDRARALAMQLGVGTRSVSLAAQFRAIDWAPVRTLLGFGVALTMSGEPAASWHKLAAPTPAPSTLPRPSTPNPGRLEMRPTPLFSPRPVPMPTTPTGGPVSHSAPADVVPIDVPDTATAIVSNGDVSQTVAADQLRLSVAIARGDKTPDDSRLKGLPDPAIVERQLRAMPGVVDVAVQGTPYDPLPIGYELVARAWDQTRVAHLAATISSKYARFHVALMFGTSLVLSDCADQVLHAQQASVDQAEHRAVVAANDQDRRLRRLVLAAAYPPVTGDFCNLNALPDAVDRARDETLILPKDRFVTLRVPVKLTFRASSSSH